jgi:hypothetical protein
VGLTASDHGHLVKFRSFLKSTHPIPYKLDKKNVHSCRINIRSGRLVKSLERFGVVPRKSHIASPPDFVRGSPDFWRGCVDGDGHVAIEKRGGPIISLTGTECMCGAFAEFIRKHTQRIVKIYKHRMWNVSANCELAKTMAKVLYENPCVSLDRKQAVAEEIMKISKSYRIFLEKDINHA